MLDLIILFFIMLFFWKPKELGEVLGGIWKDFKKGFKEKEE